MSPRLDPYSPASVAVEQYFNEILLGSATSFVWKRRDALYLVTNWHVVTCRNSETGKHIRSDIAEPNMLVGNFRAHRGSFETQQRKVPLRDSENRPLWLYHPVHRGCVDVVAVPLGKEYSEFVSPINELPVEPLSVRIGMDVYVLGFPFGPNPPSLPVWKRGSIASEPEIVRLAENYYLVDTASRPGMSGAPVILRSYGIHLTDSGPSIKTKPGSKFFGVYSGRLHARDDEAQLGRVWPASFISEIIDANTRDSGE